MHEVCIREYGVLTQGEWGRGSLECAEIGSEVAWACLEELAYSNEGARCIETARHDGKKAFRVLNMVGVITLPDGTQIEILPKTSEAGQDLGQTRSRLWQMLSAVEELPLYDATEAELMLSDRPLVETLIARFLNEVATLVRRGLRKDYARIEEEERFLKGRLNIARQLRQPPGRGHLFQIEYDVFSENRAENRLIHSALTRAAKWSRSEANQRLAWELRGAFADIPRSSDHRRDLDGWSDSRHMVHYRPIKAWVRLILNEKCPLTLKNQHAGISFLFKMEELFEKYVSRTLGRQLSRQGFVLKEQLRGRYLSEKPKAFLLKPDVGIFLNGRLIAILDTKWKLIDCDAKYEDGKPDPKAGIDQSDMYQLYVYGQKYLSGCGKLILVYPRWTRFSEPLVPFELGGRLGLHALPFDLEEDCCVGLQKLLEDPGVN